MYCFVYSYALYLILIRFFDFFILESKLCINSPNFMLVLLLFMQVLFAVIFQEPMHYLFHWQDVGIISNGLLVDIT